MEMVFALFIILAGGAYLLKQIHNESRGLISGILIVFVCFSIPVLLVKVAGEINNDLGIILGILLVCAILGGGLYAIINNDKLLADSTKESMEIWDEVYKLPLPDEKTIKQYKLANKIPLYPEDVKAYNDAAIQAWRNNEYNKRFKEKHKIIFYIK